MKKFWTAALVLLMLLALAVPVFAAGSASLSGPSTVRAGDTITLSFKAGGGIYGGSGKVTFDASQLTLKSYSQSIGGGWAVEFSGNSFVFYDNTMQNPITGSSTIFKATFQVSQSLTPGTQVKVSVSGTLSDGTSDTGFSGSYSTAIAEPLSDNAYLKSLTVSNATLSPAFNRGKTSYSVCVPFTTSKLEVSAKAEHSGAKVKINNPTLPAGGTGKVTITVTAEDGTTKTYTIQAARAQDPNYVPSGENALESLEVEGFRLSPAFDPEILAYGVYLPNEVDSLSIIPKAKDTKAEAEVKGGQGLAVGKTVIEIPVTAENGDIKTYTVTAFRAEPFGIEPTEPVTEPTTEPTTEPATEPTTQPATEPATEPAPAPTEPVEVPQTPSLPGWLWPTAILLGTALGSLLTLLVQKLKRK